MMRLRGFMTAIRERSPLTMQGLVVVLIAVLALQRFGYGRMDLVVFALAVCALAIVSFSTIIVLLGGLILRNQLMHQLEMRDLQRNQPTHIQVEAGYPNDTGFALHTMPWLPLIGISWEVMYPDAIETRNLLSADEQEWEEQIRPLRRGRSNRVTRRFTVRDVLGFSRFSWRFTQPGELLALPQAGRIKALPLLRSLTSEDGIPDPGGNPEGDRMEIRPYVPGDSVRDIMWKVYARNRHLNVRLPERSVFHSNRTLAYLLSSADDEAAAAVARVAVESGALGEDWLFGADGSEGATSVRSDALERIAQSRALDGPLPYGLDAFLQQHAGQGSLHCIVFAGANSAPWLPLLRATTTRFRVRFSVVLATDGFQDDRPPPLLQRLLFGKLRHRAGTMNADSTSRGRLSTLLTQLGQLVESTLVVDRHTGQTFSGQLKPLRDARS